MKQEVKEQWVTALRSGEYEQGKGALSVRDESGSKKYCCLGVLCELAIKAGAIGEPHPGHVSDGMEWFSYDGEDQTLPESVQEWAELDSPNPVVILPNGRCSLAQLNDGSYVAGKQFTFHEIADVVETQL